MEKDISTEEKIKEAARQIFHQKGYAGTRTRDIAEAAGINLALLNYYYRSKEKLFEIVMQESIVNLVGSLRKIWTNETSSLKEKISFIVDSYIDILMKNPNLPIFVLGEIQANPDKFIERMGLTPTYLSSMPLFKQLEEQLKITGLSNLHPMHMIVNILSMTIFPFLGKPALKGIAEMDESAYVQFLEDRRYLIPLWVNKMLKIE